MDWRIASVGTANFACGAWGMRGAEIRPDCQSAALWKAKSRGTSSEDVQSVSTFTDLLEFRSARDGPPLP